MYGYSPIPEMDSLVEKCRFFKNIPFDKNEYFKSDVIALGNDIIDHFTKFIADSGTKVVEPLDCLPNGVKTELVLNEEEIATIKCRHGCDGPIGIYHVPEGCNCFDDPIQALCDQHFNKLHSPGRMVAIVRRAKVKDPLADVKLSLEIMQGLASDNPYPAYEKLKKLMENEE